jgi:L-alanine-DL-glutamate epimerase-like enolase superfamily enzyme
VLRLAELLVHRVRIPLRRRVRHASHTRDDTESLVVRCRLESGETGWGEGLPRDYVTGESIDAAWQLACAQPWGQILPREWADLPDLVGQLGLIGQVAGSGQPGVIPLQGVSPGTRPCFGNSLRCAVELAILGAACQAANQPLMAVTRLVPETMAIRKLSPRVQYSAAVTAMPGWREWIRLLKLRVYDFGDVKVKVGVSGRDDAVSLRRLRRVLGERIDLRIDANGAWRPDELVEKIAPLREFRLSAIEQPVPHELVAGLAAVREAVGVPIMLDESVASIEDVYAAAEQGWADLFNLRLSKCGGFIPTLRMAAASHRAGLGYSLGCQVGETGILSAAGRHFACSVDGLRYREGSYDRHLVRESLIREEITFRYGGWANALTAPGLGVTIDEPAVQRVTSATHRWVK